MSLNANGRTQHCWATTPNTVGCCMLCPTLGSRSIRKKNLLEPRVVVSVQSLKPVKCLATCKRTQQPPDVGGSVGPFARSSTSLEKSQQNTVKFRK